MQTNQSTQTPTSQTPSIQPEGPTPPSITTSTPQPETPEKKFPKWLIILVIFLLLGATGIFAYQNYQLKQKLVDKQQSPSPQITINSPSPSPTSEAKESETVSIDGIWNKYINHQYGYSIYVPKQSMSGYGSCEWSEKDGDHSYRPKNDNVPVQIIEDNNVTYLAGEYFYQLAGETKETVGLGTRSYYSECNKTPIILETLKQDNTFQMYWELVVGDAKNDTDLEQFIKKEYGNACKLGDKKTSVQEKVYDIVIDQGNWVDPEEARQRECNVNYAYVMKYYPENNRVISWKLGQAVTFWRDSYNTLDEIIVKSFQFISVE